MADAKRLSEHFVVLGPDLSGQTVAVTDTVWQDIDSQFGDFAGSALVSTFRFDAAWPTWEMHPAGDEFVYLLDGDTDMILATPDGESSLRLSEPGQFVLVPRGRWHTARPHAPTSMLFVTPGQGTENRETLPWEKST